MLPKQLLQGQEQTVHIEELLEECGAYPLGQTVLHVLLEAINEQFAQQEIQVVGDEHYKQGEIQAVH